MMATTHSELCRMPARAEVEALGLRLRREFPQLDLPVKETFAPGVYLREIFMPKGAFVIGHRHRTEHLNIISCGEVSVLMEGKVHRLVAPCTILSRAGERKVLFIHEDTLWATVHPTTTTDPAALEDELIYPPPPDNTEELPL